MLANRVGLNESPAGPEHELSDDQVERFEERGYLLLEGVFDGEEVDALSTEMNRMIDEWAVEDMGWGGDWREDYLDPEERESTSLIHLHDMQFYSEVYARMIQDPRIVRPVTQLVGPDVEFHHTTLHAKPPDRGTPFPMHQDWAFYRHEGPAFVDALVHLDDVPPEKGPLQFLEGSHAQGPLEHIRGEGQAPHLPTDEYRLEDATEVPASAGDVILFHVHTIHGSDRNLSDEMRRLVRIGYKDPANPQIDGQAADRDSIMVAGQRRAADME